GRDSFDCRRMAEQAAGLPESARDIAGICMLEVPQRMNIAVCVKQVPDTTAKKDLTQDFRLNRASLESVLNPFDEYAIEEAIRQQTAHTGDVVMVTMGPASAEETMRK